MKLHVTRANSKGKLKFNKLWLVAIALIIIVVIAVAFAAVGIANTANSRVGTVVHAPIRIDASNSTGMKTTLSQSLLIAPTKNDLMVVATASCNQGFPAVSSRVLTISDNLSTTFTYGTSIITRNAPIGNPYGLGYELWTGRFTGTGTTDNITVTWKAANGPIDSGFFVNTYMNVNITGNVQNITGIGLGGFSASSLTVPMTINGGWIVGGALGWSTLAWTDTFPQIQRGTMLPLTACLASSDFSDLDSFGKRSTVFSENNTSVDRWGSAALELIPSLQPTNPCTASNVGTSQCALPQNGCDGVLRAYGRCEAGTNTCSFASLATSCVVTQSFPTPFTNAPKFVSVNIASAIPGAKLFLGTASFVTNLTTWYSFPASSTEAFGSGTNFRLNFTSAFSGITPVLSMYVLTGSTSSTAAIQLQFSTNGGAGWSNACSVTFGTGTGWFFCVPAPKSASATNGIMFRMVGLNGNGVGDNPVFQRMYLEFDKLVNTLTIEVINITTTTFQVLFQAPAPENGTPTITFAWKAISETG